jgi:hypothetical protein
MTAFSETFSIVFIVSFLVGVLCVILYLWFGDLKTKSKPTKPEPYSEVFNFEDRLIRLLESKPEEWECIYRGSIMTRVFHPPTRIHITTTDQDVKVEIEINNNGSTRDKTFYAQKEKQFIKAMKQWRAWSKQNHYNEVSNLINERLDNYAEDELDKAYAEVARLEKLLGGGENK